MVSILACLLPLIGFWMEITFTFQPKFSCMVEIQIRSWTWLRLITLEITHENHGTRLERIEWIENGFGSLNRRISSGNWPEESLDGLRWSKSIFISRLRGAEGEIVSVSAAAAHRFRPTSRSKQPVRCSLLLWIFWRSFPTSQKHTGFYEKSVQRT